MINERVLLLFSRKPGSPEHSGATTIVGARLRDVVLLRDTGRLVFAAVISGVMTLHLRIALGNFSTHGCLDFLRLFFAEVYLSAIVLLRIPSIDETQAVRDRLTGVWALVWKKMPVTEN